MWKITTRGFTLEEVLILAAMNLLASADAAARRARTRRRRNIQGGYTWGKSVRSKAQELHLLES